MSTIQRFNPASLATPPGYSHAVSVGPGRWVYTSGQVALDREGKLVGAGDIAAQAEQVFANVAAALAAAGADFSHVVKLTTFVTELGPAALAAFRAARDRYVAPQHAPASLLVQVAGLFRPDLLIEVEAIAVVPG